MSERVKRCHMWGASTGSALREKDVSCGEFARTTRDGGATWDATQWEYGVPGGQATAKVYADSSRVATVTLPTAAGAIAGAAIAAHGADRFAKGFWQFYKGEVVQSCTQRLIESVGIRSDMAAQIDGVLAVGLTMGASGMNYTFSGQQLFGNVLRTLCWLPFLTDGVVASTLVFLRWRFYRRVKCRYLKSRRRKERQ